MFPPLPPTATLVTVVATLAVAVGAGITLVARRAARRRHSRPLALFSYGFAAITVGLLGNALAALALGWGAVESLLVGTVPVAAGFGLLARSLLVGRPRAGPPTG